MIPDFTSIDSEIHDRTRFGNVLETFVFGDLLKHTTTADGDYRLMVYWDTEKFEMDVVMVGISTACVTIVRTAT